VIVSIISQGKSFILRLYDPTEAVISVDGKSISEYRLADFKNATSLIFYHVSAFRSPQMRYNQ